MVFEIFRFLISIIILIFSADKVLDSSEKVGHKVGLSPLFIGLFIVGFGTSLPELVVCHFAMTKNVPEIAIGNIIGSNLGNLFLILGVSGLMVKIDLDRKSLRSQLWIHFFQVIVLILLFKRGKIDYVASAVLLSVFIMHILYTSISLKAENATSKVESKNVPYFWPVQIFILSIGLFGMFFSGEQLVESGRNICISMGLNEYYVSVIFLALGTSFPELITSILATIKKRDLELIVGNVVGSNMINSTFILGSLGVYKFKLNETYLTELLLLFLGSVLLISFSKLFKKELARPQGILFLVAYFSLIIFWANSMKSI